MPSNPPIPYAFDDMVAEIASILAQGYLHHRKRRQIPPESRDWPTTPISGCELRVTRAGPALRTPERERRKVTSPPSRDPRLPVPGTLLAQEFRGRNVVVKVLDEGFEFEDRQYQSLSAIAKDVTGSKWNGFLFFGIAGGVDPRTGTRTKGLANDPDVILCTKRRRPLRHLHTFLPGHAEAEEEAEWLVNRLVENDVRSLPEDFLVYHRSTLSPYRGMRRVVVETDEYLSAHMCAKSVLNRTANGRIL